MTWNNITDLALQKQISLYRYRGDNQKVPLFTRILLLRASDLRQKILLLFLQLTVFESWMFEDICGHG